MRSRSVPLLVLVLALLVLGGVVAVSASLPDRQIQTAAGCDPWPSATGETVSVSTEEQIWNAVNGAQSGETILIADGTYNLAFYGYYIWIDTPELTLRSASGDREAVVLDDNYSGSEIITVAASDVTIADLTVKRASTHPIHVTSSDAGDTLNTMIYNVHIVDPGQQAIKINPHAGRVHFPDYGEVACSHIELTDAGRPMVLAINGSCYTGGVDAHTAQGWTIRDNLIEGFWCASGGLSEHGVHIWSDSSDTVVERNLLRNNARGIGFGLGASQHLNGIIRNNMVHTIQDVGIGLESAPGARVLNNSVYTQNYANAIEYRFSATTGVAILNNLSNGAIASRDGGSGTVEDNLTGADPSWFVDAAGGDLHLISENIPGVVDAGRVLAEVTDDFDGQDRPQGAGYDIGADEYRLPIPDPVRDLRVAEAITTTGSLTVTLRWTPAAGAITSTLRYHDQSITEANWESASSLVEMLAGELNVYTGTVPFDGSTLYFALKSGNADGLWSELSNNAFWPVFPCYLPFVQRGS